MIFLLVVACRQGQMTSSPQTLPQWAPKLKNSHLSRWVIRLPRKWPLKTTRHSRHRTISSLPVDSFPATKASSPLVLPNIWCNNLNNSGAVTTTKVKTSSHATTTTTIWVAATITTRRTQCSHAAVTSMWSRAPSPLPATSTWEPRRSKICHKCQCPTTCICNSSSPTGCPFPTCPFQISNRILCLCIRPTWTSSQLLSNQLHRSNQLKPLHSSLRDLNRTSWTQPCPWPWMQLSIHFLLADQLTQLYPTSSKDRPSIPPWLPQSHWWRCQLVSLDPQVLSSLLLQLNHSYQQAPLSLPMSNLSCHQSPSPLSHQMLQWLSQTLHHLFRKWTWHPLASLQHPLLLCPLLLLSPLSPRRRSSFSWLRESLRVQRPTLRLLILRQRIPRKSM